MSWRKRQRRRLLWAGALLGLALLVAATSAVRFGLWARDALGRAVPPRRRLDASGR